MPVRDSLVGILWHREPATGQRSYVRVRPKPPPSGRGHRRRDRNYVVRENLGSHSWAEALAASHSAEHAAPVPQYLYLGYPSGVLGLTNRPKTPSKRPSTTQIQPSHRLCKDCEIVAVCRSWLDRNS